MDVKNVMTKRSVKPKIRGYDDAKAKIRFAFEIYLEKVEMGCKNIIVLALIII